MKKIMKIASIAFVAIWFVACGDYAKPIANNLNAANANTNTAKTTAAAPTADALLAIEKQANEAYIKGDGKFFEGMLSDKMVMSEQGSRMDKAAVVKMVGTNKCEVKEGWTLTEPQMAKINDDTYVLSYKTAMDGSCTGPDGKSMKIPTPNRAATVWVRNGEKWQAAFHGENLIVDPKAPPAAPPAADKKEEPKKDDKAAANANTTSAPAPAKPTADPSTDAMMAVEKSIWEAWKAKDAKKIEDLTAKDITFVNIFGTYFANKADVIKDWTGATCDVKSFALTDGVGTSVSPTVGILTLKGSADGTCGGQKVSSVYGTSVYVKDGETWKWAFGFNSPA